MLCPDDDDDEEEEEEEDVMKEMTLCTPWISTPFDFPPAKKIDFITQHPPPPLSKTKSIIGPNSAPDLLKQREPAFS